MLMLLRSQPAQRARPSLQPLAGSWQLAQAMVLSADSRRSKNRSLPSSTFSGVWGLPTGTGTGPSTRSASRRETPDEERVQAKATAASTGTTKIHQERSVGCPPQRGRCSIALPHPKVPLMQPAPASGRWRPPSFTATMQHLSTR